MGNCLKLDDQIKSKETYENYKGRIINRITHSIPIYIETFEDIYTFEFNFVRYGKEFFEDVSITTCSEEREKELEREFEIYGFEFPEKEYERPFFYFVKVFDKTGKVMPEFYSVLSGPNSYRDEAISYYNEMKFYEAWDKQLLPYIYSGEIHYSNKSIRYNMEYDMANIMIEILGIVFDKPWVHKYKTKKEKNEELEGLIYMLLNTDKDEEPENWFDFHRIISEIPDIPTANHYMRILASFLEYVVENKIFKQCPRCCDFFVYKKDKKYCSNYCLTSIANRRNYVRKLKGKGKRPTENLDYDNTIQ